MDSRHGGRHGTVGGTLILVVTLVLAGCRSDPGPSTADKAAASKGASVAAVANASAKPNAEKRAYETRVYRECRHAVQPLDKALSHLLSRVRVGAFDPRGPNFEEYAQMSDSVQPAYHRSIRRLKRAQDDPYACETRVAERLETAMNADIDAYNAWLDCVRADSRCGYWGSKPLRNGRAKWARADLLVTDAESALAAMQA